MANSTHNTEHHQENKGNYSLISVDVAPEEEVIRVDAAGVHRVPSQGVCVDVDGEGSAGGDANVDVGDSGKDVNTSASDVLQACGDAEVEASRAVDSCRDADNQTLEDLKQPVPFAGMQRAIIVLLVILLVAFVIYFMI